MKHPISEHIVPYLCYFKLLLSIWYGNFRASYKHIAVMKISKRKTTNNLLWFQGNVT